MIYLPLLLSSTPTSKSSSSSSSSPTLSTILTKIQSHYSANKWFRQPQNLRHMGEQKLRQGNVITQLYDAIELSVVHEHQIPYLLLQYFVGYNRSLWLTITPCTNYLDRVQFSASSAYYQPWEESKTYGLKLSQSKTHPRLSTQPTIRVEPFPSELNLPKYRISHNGNQVNYLSRSRFHYSKINYEMDSLNIRLYGKPGDAYNIRLSTRRTPTHTYDGYPIVAPHSKISVCLVQNTNDTLDLQWDPTLNNDMKSDYCVVINSEENLYYHCTALARLNQSPQQSSVFINKFKKPEIFKQTDHYRNKLINSFVYKCTHNPNLRIRLSSSLSHILQNLDHNFGDKLFVNVYAINTKMDLSTAYPVKILQYNSVESCQTLRRLYKIRVRNEPVINDLLWNTNIALDWLHTTSNTTSTTNTTIIINHDNHNNKSKNNYNEENSDQIKLYFQPCRLNNPRLNPYKISVHQYVNNSTSKLIRKICEHKIIDQEIFPSCLNSQTGKYLLYPDGKTNFKSGDPIVRFFFMKTNSSLLPQRPNNTDFPTDLNHIIQHTTTNQTGNLKTYRLKRAELLHNNSTLKSVQIENKFSKHIPYAFPKNHKFRRLTTQAGLDVGVDCYGHQIYISVVTHTNPHYYWIYTIPLANEWVENPDYLKNLTDYCEFPVQSLLKLTKRTWEPIYCHTINKQEKFYLFLPAYHLKHYPRYYLLFVYFASKYDSQGQYKQLLIQQILDMCSITSSGCYPQMGFKCLKFYPSTLPKFVSHSYNNPICPDYLS